MILLHRAPKTPHINLEKITDTAEVINIYEVSPG